MREIVQENTTGKCRTDTPLAKTFGGLQMFIVCKKCLGRHLLTQNGQDGQWFREGRARQCIGKEIYNGRQMDGNGMGNGLGNASSMEKDVEMGNPNTNNH